MYKIYYNDTLILLAHLAFERFFARQGENQLLIYYSGNPKHLLSCLDKIEKNQDLREVVVLAEDTEKLKTAFFSLFKIVSAAGGLVVNDSQSVLMIYRRGFWDLPKGKIESGESKKAAALREVKEETGLTHLVMVQKLVKTYHIYQTSGKKRVLKPTHWYLMHTMDTILVPQSEEDIEKALWVKYQRALDELNPIYTNIGLVLRYFDGLLK